MSSAKRIFGNWRCTARAEHGQALLLVVAALLALLGTGALVLWVGLSTHIAARDQTAADAAAYAGEKELVRELSHPPVVDGQVIQVRPNQAEIAAAASRFAGLNDGTLISATVIPTPGSGWGYDVEVKVASNQKLPSGSIDPGAGAVEQARASTDPFASPTADISDGQTTTGPEPASAQVGLGNPSIHLVALSGGPQGTFGGGVAGGPPASLDESQIQVACQIYAVARANHLPTAELYVGLVAAVDESDLGQNTGGNSTDPGQSVGVFQQISDDGWGTIADELNVTTAAEMFFLGANSGIASTTGLEFYYDRDPSAPSWELAQHVQRSGAGAGSDGRGNYGSAQVQSEASSILARIQGGACSAQA